MAASKLRLPTVLPQLSGPALLAYRIAWGAVLLLALVLPLAGALHFSEVDDRRHYTPFREFGLRWQSGAASLGQPFGAEAKRQGIVRDAALLSINDEPIPAGSSRVVADPVARAVQIVLAREEREAEVHAWRRGQEERFAMVEAALARLATGAPSPGKGNRQAC